MQIYLRIDGIDYDVTPRAVQPEPQPEPEPVPQRQASFTAWTAPWPADWRAEATDYGVLEGLFAGVRFIIENINMHGDDFYREKWLPKWSTLAEAHGFGLQYFLTGGPSVEALAATVWPDNCEAVMIASDVVYTPERLAELAAVLPERLVKFFPESWYPGPVPAYQDGCHIWKRVSPWYPWSGKADDMRSPMVLAYETRAAIDLGPCVVKAGPQLWNDTTGEGPETPENIRRGLALVCWASLGKADYLGWGLHKGTNEQIYATAQVVGDAVRELNALGIPGDAKATPAEVGVYVNPKFLPSAYGAGHVQMFMELVCRLNARVEPFYDMAQATKYKAIIVGHLLENDWTEQERAKYAAYCQARVATLEEALVNQIAANEVGWKIANTQAAIEDYSTRVARMEAEGWPVANSFTDEQWDALYESDTDVITGCGDVSPYGGKGDYLSRIPDDAAVLPHAPRTNRPTFAIAPGENFIADMTVVVRYLRGLLADVGADCLLDSTTVLRREYTAGGRIALLDIDSETGTVTR